MKSVAMNIAICLGLVLTGCAGTNFVRVGDDALILGQTTDQEILGQLGPPYRQGAINKNGRQLKTVTYSYSSAAGKPAAAGVVPARSQGFYFFNSKLVGYEFTSSWEEDSTNFNSGKISQIKRGKSTRDDVVRLLGNPGGKYIYPIVSNSDQEAVNYLYNQVTGNAFNMKIYNKLLVVTFDKQKVVVDIDYSESTPN